MSGFGASALLVTRLRAPPLPGVDQDWARTDALLLRLGVMLSLQLALLLGIGLLA